MNDLISILQRTFTKEFYRLNAMFFLVTVGIAFGFMRGEEHRALAEFIISAPVWSTVPAVIWILYGFKVVSFNNQVCRMKEMGFIHNLSLTSVYTQLICALAVAFNQLLPIITYGIFLIAVAIKNNVVSSALSLVVILLTLLMSVTFLLFRRIGATHVESRVSFLKQWSDRNFQKPFVQFYTEWLFRNQPGLLVTVKIFACLILFAVTQLYKFDEYDYRLLAMGAVVAFGSSLPLVHQFVLFENNKFSLLRNLPLPPATRIVHFIMSMVVVSLPEIIVLIRNFPEQLQIRFFIEILIFSFSVFLLAYKILLLKGKGFEQFSGSTFLAFISIIVLILFSVPLLLLAMAAIGAALLQYGDAFYQFEMIEEPQQSTGQNDVRK